MEFESLEIKFHKSVEVLIRVQCKKCKGKGFILTVEAKTLREKYRKLIKSKYSIEEKQEIDKEISDFEITHSYNPLVQFEICEECESSGQDVKFIDVRKLFNKDV